MDAFMVFQLDQRLILISRDSWWSLPDSLQLMCAIGQQINGVS